ncbi:MAG TPA: hypothetical protein VM165_23740 [Planctomycetaceae bacterium]|nr:hypothetical protein [Planctomycetaceae bacterium]
MATTKVTGKRITRKPSKGRTKATGPDVRPKPAKRLTDRFRFTVPCKDREPTAAELAEHRANTLTKSNGVLIAGQLVFQSDEASDIRAYVHGRGLGTQVYRSLEHPDPDKPVDYWSERYAEREAKENPLAQKLATRFELALSSIQAVLGDHFEVSPPRGEDYRNSCPADDDVASTATISLELEGEIDLRGDIAAQARDALRMMAKVCTAAADDLRAAIRGKRLDVRPVAGFAVMKDGKLICGPVDEHTADYIASGNGDDRGGEVVAMYE